MFREPPPGLAFAERFDPHARQRFDEIIQRSIRVAVVAGRKATPEAPAHSFEHALPPHILLPLLGTMVTVAIAFHSETPPVSALDDHVNPVADGTNLPLHAVSAFEQLLHQVAFKVRFAHGERIVDFLKLGHRIFKMRDETRFKVIRIEFFSLN